MSPLWNILCRVGGASLQLGMERKLILRMDTLAYQPPLRFRLGALDDHAYDI